MVQYVKAHAFIQNGFRATIQSKPGAFKNRALIFGGGTSAARFTHINLEQVQNSQREYIFSSKRRLFEWATFPRHVFVK